jgi:hypothetical protein
MLPRLNRTGSYATAPLVVKSDDRGLFLEMQKAYLNFEFVTREKHYDHSWNIKPSEYEGQGILLQGMALHKSFHLPQESLNPCGRWNSEDAGNRQTAIDAVTAPTIGNIWKSLSAI